MSSSSRPLLSLVNASAEWEAGLPPRCRASVRLLDRVHVSVRQGDCIVVHHRDPSSATVLLAALRGHGALAAGAHLTGQPLNHQLTDRGAMLERSTTTAPVYRLFALEPAYGSANWRHVLVQPELADYAFTPPTLDTVLAHDAQTADFTATPTGTVRTVTLLVWWQTGAVAEPFEAGFLLVDTTR